MCSAVLLADVLAKFEVLPKMSFQSTLAVYDMLPAKQLARCKLHPLCESTRDPDCHTGFRLGKLPPSECCSGILARSQQGTATTRLRNCRVDACNTRPARAWVVLRPHNFAD
jgi:hypothetical protein